MSDQDHDFFGTDEEKNPCSVTISWKRNKASKQLHLQVVNFSGPAVFDGLSIWIRVFYGSQKSVLTTAAGVQLSETPIVAFRGGAAVYEPAQFCFSDELNHYMRIEVYGKETKTLLCSGDKDFEDLRDQEEMYSFEVKKLNNSFISCFALSNL